MIDDTRAKALTETIIPQRIRDAIGVELGAPILTWSGDLQPVALHRARVVFGGRRVHAYNEPADEAFRTTLRQEWQLIHRFRSPIPLDVPLAVVMTFAGKDRSDHGRRLNRPDASNLVKAIEDAGNGVLWTDDSQIRTIVGIITAWGREVRPLVTVEAWELGR